MKLLELFDKPVQFTVDEGESHSTYKFSIEHSGGRENYIASVDIASSRFVDGLSDMFGIPIEDDVIVVSFSNESREFSTEILNISDKRVARITFSTIVSILKDFLNKNRSVKGIHFTSDLSRLLLYRKIGERFGKVHVVNGNISRYYVEINK